MYAPPPQAAPQFNWKPRKKLKRYPDIHFFMFSIADTIQLESRILILQERIQGLLETWGQKYKGSPNCAICPASKGKRKFQCFPTSRTKAFSALFLTEKDSKERYCPPLWKYDNGNCTVMAWVTNRKMSSSWERIIQWVASLIYCDKLNDADINQERKWKLESWTKSRKVVVMKPELAINHFSELLVLYGVRWDLSVGNTYQVGHKISKTRICKNSVISVIQWAVESQEWNVVGM